MAWGFSEVYTHLPERLMPEGPEVAGYYIMVKDTEISAGDGAPAECLELPGLHNVAAKLQKPSPEFADLPTTGMGVPDFASMTKSQKQRFLKLCAVDTAVRQE